MSPLPLYWYRVHHPATHAPIVLVHGFTGSRDSWQPVVRELAIDATVAAAPLPGHHPGIRVAHGYEANADWLADVVRGAHLAGCHLVGYSMGARLALAAAVRHPDIATRLTLIGSHPGLDDPAARAARAERDRVWCDLLRGEGIAAFVDAWERQPLFATQRFLSREAQDGQRAIRLAHDAAALAACLDELGLARMPAYGDRVAELAMPVEVVVGGQDRKFAALAAQLAARAPGVEVVTIRGCGHNVLLERPVELAQILSRPSVRPSPAATADASAAASAASAGAGAGAMAGTTAVLDGSRGRVGS